MANARGISMPEFDCVYTFNEQKWRELQAFTVLIFEWFLKKSVFILI